MQLLQPSITTQFAKVLPLYYWEIPEIYLSPSTLPLSYSRFLWPPHCVRGCFPYHTGVPSPRLSLPSWTLPKLWRLLDSTKWIRETIPTLRGAGSSLFQETSPFVSVPYQDQGKLTGKGEFMRSQTLQLKTWERYTSAWMQQACTPYLSRKTIKLEAVWMQTKWHFSKAGATQAR